MKLWAIEYTMGYGGPCWQRVVASTAEEAVEAAKRQATARYANDGAWALRGVKMISEVDLIV